MPARTGTNTVYLATRALRQQFRIEVFKSIDGGATFGAPVPWNLRVADQGGGDVGTIGCFELMILQARRGQ